MVTQPAPPPIQSQVVLPAIGTVTASLNDMSAAALSCVVDAGSNWIQFVREGLTVWPFTVGRVVNLKAPTNAVPIVVTPISPILQLGAGFIVPSPANPVFGTSTTPTLLFTTRLLQPESGLQPALARQLRQSLSVSAVVLPPFPTLTITPSGATVLTLTVSIPATGSGAADITLNATFIVPSGQTVSLIALSNVPTPVVKVFVLPQVAPGDSAIGALPLPASATFQVLDHGTIHRAAYDIEALATF